jgi:hypothetical protein
MDRNRIDKEHLVERYLADQLNAADAAAFEAYYTQNPDMVRDIERTLRLKEGLAVLRERGELDSLIRARPRWTLPLALAAALAAAVIGAWLWMAHSAATPLAGALAELADSSGRPVPVASTLVLARTRGGAPTIEIPLPPERGAIELRMLPSSRTANERYQATVSRINVAGVTSPLGDVRGLRTSEEGFVTAYLDTAKLQPGRYSLELQPERSDSPGTITDRFVIDLR